MTNNLMGIQVTECVPGIILPNMMQQNKVLYKVILTIRHHIGSYGLPVLMSRKAIIELAKGTRITAIVSPQVSRAIQKHDSIWMPKLEQDEAAGYIKLK
jgi:hypothetical protein